MEMSDFVTGGPNVEIPLGFGMALAQNTQAMERFSALSHERREALIAGARAIHSKAEMAAYVNQIPGGV